MEAAWLITWFYNKWAMQMFPMLFDTSISIRVAPPEYVVKMTAYAINVLQILYLLV